MILSHHIFFILFAEVLSHMIKKDINIKGIFINNKELTLSQYADDTEFISRRFIDILEK